MELSLTAALLLKKELEEKIETLEWPKPPRIRTKEEMGAYKEYEIKKEEVQGVHLKYTQKLKRVQSIIDHAINEV